jgi:hypothetical protein
MKHRRSTIAPFLGALLAQFFTLTHASAQSASSVVLGSCNIVQQNLSVTNGSTVINEVDCVPPSVEDSFSLRYIWLDATMSSLLVAGYFDSSIKPLVGTMQTVVKNSVFHRVEEIVHRFGSPISNGPLLQRGSSYTLMGGRGDISIDNNGDPIPLSVLKKLKIYDAEQAILLPDVNALRTIIGGNGWPTDYRLTYSDDTNAFTNSTTKKDKENASLMCALLYKPVSKEMLANYWNDIELLESLVEKKEFRQEQVQNVKVTEGTDFRVEALQNPSLPAMQYFGENNWPNDFLLAFGSAFTRGCGDTETYNIGFYAQPRKLFTLVAVIQGKANSIEIQRMNFNVDPSDGLHTLATGTKIEAAPPGSIVLQRGQTALVPLRIELRYDLDETPVRPVVDSTDAKKLYTKINSMPSDPFEFRAKDTAANTDTKQPPLRTVFQKAKSAFRAPEAMAVTKTYVFGLAYDLKDITLRGQAISVRSAPASALAFVGDTGVGSCPFLFVGADSEQFIKLGRILIGASAESLTRREQIKLPAGTRFFYISEQEPEVTHIQEVIASDEEGFTEVLAQNVELRPGWSKKFEIPERLKGRVQLDVRGYYKRLDMRNAQLN